MKRKRIARALLVCGFVLVFTSLILTFVATSQSDVIGGADLPTFFFVFLRQNGSVYSIICFMGLTQLLIGTVLAMVKKKR